MPAASSKRATPARKKAKVVPEVDDSVSDSLNTPTPPPQATDIEGENDDNPVPAAEEVTKATRTSTRAKAKPSTSKLATQQAVNTLSEPSTPAPSSSTSALKTSKIVPPKSAKGKGKAKLEDEDFDFDDELFYGKNSDVEIFSQQGPLSALNRIQLKSQKARSLRTVWLQGVYHPPFFGIPLSQLTSTVANEDADSQPAEVRKRSAANALPWPSDAHVKTWLDSAAYPSIKKDLISFWYGQVGWVPEQGIYDWGWFPGKAFGWAQHIERSEWAQDARQALRQNPDTTNKVIMRGQHPGWPFVQPWLDVQSQNLTLLNSKDAQPYLQDTTTPQRSALRHPMTVMKLAVPELSMRNRLKKSLAGDTPKKVVMSGAGDSNADTGADEDDDAAGAASDGDDDNLAALDANQEPINPNDPKFANIPNVGFEEKGPVCGDVLHVSVGPPDQEVPVQIAKGTSRRLDSLGLVPDEGHLLNAGGHVYTLDWVPVPVHLNTGKEYFVVSAAASKAPLTMIGQKQNGPTPASLQIWSVSPDSPPSTSSSSSSSAIESKGEARLEMVLCHQLGAAFKLAWCPIGHDFVSENNSGKAAPRRLGLLAGCFADGSVSVFSVPHPDSVQQKQVKTPLHIRVDPVLKLEHPQQPATSLAWAGGEMLAFGGSHGWIGVWNVGRIFRSPSPPTSSTLPPDYTVRAHRSSVTDLTFILLPPIDANGIACTSTLPTTLFSVSLDGVHVYNDLSRGAPVSIERSRVVHYACAFAAFSGGSLVHENADGSVTHYSMRPEEMLRERTISYAPSRVVSLSASSFHPMIAMGTAHGELKVANILRTLRRCQRHHLPVYQQFINRSTGELVVRHHLQPEIATVAEHKSWHLAQWHPCLAVCAVRWNPNLGRSRLVLSGTASGMVKVDFVKPPYEV